ncbi:FxSxx-COOH system tetratricopeptide repeat protein [Nocardiopsis sp. RSe5-2]|uniref:FxSxx-COOH system tetratricopeptide repeat protein n=1 Tax=Nocardiopsis endophytica TaxID=3018445 RepID=A0ABT4U189_9ACTN|nr:FxSxx-COOH system tetratricopeptide repeat protein [Nocardiopsis endophytica]MDA2810713.1 FxSxx-COOH system tetratricopeptide repeat protein [Nocardiopsis endophytica]
MSARGERPRPRAEQPRAEGAEREPPPDEAYPQDTAEGPLWWEVADAVWLAARSGGAPDAAGGPPPPAPHGAPARQEAGPDAPEGSPGADDEPLAPPGLPGEPGPTADAPGDGTPGSAGAPPGAGAPFSPVRPDRGGQDDLAVPGPAAGPASDLPDPQGLVRALLRLRRTRLRPGAGPLDEHATAEGYAERALAHPSGPGARGVPLLPRFSGEPASPDSLTVLVDAGLSMLVHEPRVKRFLELLAPLKVCARTRVLRMDSDKAWHDDLVLRSEHGPAPSPRRLVADGGSHVVLVLTDGVGEGWHRGAVPVWLARWGRTAAVGVVQLLDRAQWPRTGIRPRLAVLRPPEDPGPAVAPNAAYRTVPAAPVDGLAEPFGPGRPGAAPDGAVPVPVVPLDTDELGAWAGFVSQRPEAHELNASVLYAEEATGDPPPSAQPRPLVRRGAGPDPADAGELVARFRETASAPALELAVCLAAVPLNLPTAHAVRARFVPEATASDLAEALWSGLVVRRPGGIPITRADQVSLGFRPGVRAALLASGGTRERIRALLALAAERFAGAAPWMEAFAALLHGRTFDPALPPVHDETAPIARALRPAMRALPGVMRTAADLWDVAPAGGTGPAGPEHERAREPAPAHHQERPEQRDDVAAGDSVFPGAGRGGAPAAQRPGVPAQEARPERPAAPEPPRPPGQRGRPAVWGRVPPRNPSFVGRHDLLEELARRLASGDTHILPQALRGMGGVGKTQLATEFAWRHRDEYDLVWWIPADTPTQIQQSLIDLAPRLGVDIDRDPTSISRSVLEALRSGEPHSDWLLVYDNAADPEDVRPLLPSGGPGQVLITSRSSQWRNAGGNLLEVDVFRREESIELLRKRGPEALTGPDADLIADKLGDLPLAVEQTAVWLYETMMDPRDWLEVFDEKQEELLTSVAPSPDYPWTVGATMNMALDRLYQTDPAALRLLQVCAFLAPQPISRRLFNGARNVEGPRELQEILSDPAVRLGRVLRSIDRYALARMDHRNGTFQLHKLVQETLKLPLTEEQRAEYRHCAHQLLANYEPGDPESVADWPRYAELQPHVWETEQWDCQSPWCRQLVINQAQFLMLWGRLRASRTLAETAIRHWTHHLGDEEPQTLRLQALYAVLLSMFGDFDDSHELTLHVVDSLTRLYGPDDAETLRVSNDLPTDLRNLGRFHEAVEVSERILASQERLMGRDDPVTLQVAHIHAVGLRLIGRFDEAMEIDRYNLQRRIEILGPENLRTLSSEYCLALGHMESGDYWRALDIMEGSRTVIERNYPADNQFRLGALLVLAAILRRIGRLEEALDISDETYRLYLEREGPDSLLSLQATGCHAVALRAVGEHDQALTLSERALNALRAAYGEDHPLPADAAVNHAVILRLVGRLEEAKKLDEQALRVHEARLGHEHPNTVANAVNLASDLFALGRPEQALEQDARTHRTAREVLGENHPLTLVVWRNLLLDRAAVEGTVPEEERAAMIARYGEVFGPEHPATRSAERDVRGNCDLMLNLL